MYHQYDPNVFVPPKSDSKKKRIVCVGDSITAGLSRSCAPPIGQKGYPLQLQGLLGDAFEVINLGICSRKMQKDKSPSYWNEVAFSRSQQMDPDILIIMLGTNDAWDWDQESFTSDYRSLLEIYQ